MSTTTFSDPITELFKHELDKFSMPQDLTYLNCAYMSPLLREVEEAGISGVLRKRNPTAIVAGEFFNDTEILREAIGRLINTIDYQRIVTIPSVSYGMANVANNLRLSKGENIILAGEQFPSNYYPWKKVCDKNEGELKLVEAPEALEGRAKTWNENLLKSIDKNTRAVSISHIHWADGTKFDLAEIRKRTREVGALLIIDGTQSIGALPFSIQDIQPDALICAGYKWLFGPYSIGFAYYGPYFDGGEPIEENWINRKDSDDFAGLVKYKDEYQPSSLRYEVGEHSNFILIPMFLKAIQQVNQWNPSNIQKYCRVITEEALGQLDKDRFFVENLEDRSSHLFGIRFKQKFNVDKLKERFSEENIILSIRGNAVRVSTHIFNKPSDLMKLVNMLNNEG